MDLLQDLRFAIRVLRKNPAFTALAVLTLTLAIGGNTALFTLADELLLQELNVPEPDRLVYLSFSTSRFKDQLGFSLRDYEALRRADAALSQLAAVSMYGRFTVNVNGSPELVSGEHLGGGYFSMMGVKPALGRLITPEDDQFGSAHVVVLSHGCWTRRFGADSGVIGRELVINGERAVIIGVTPASFNGINPGYAPELRIPLSRRPMASGERGRQLDAYATLIGRLKPGVSLEKAEAYLRTVYAARLREKAEHLNGAAREGFVKNGAYLQVKQLGRGIFGLDKTYGAALFIALAITGVVLLIACVNLAGLLLSQAERRQYEIGVRMAIGASRGRIIRQFLAESLLLSVLGTAAGLLFAYWATGLAVSMAPGGGFGRLLPVEIGSGLSFRTFAFATALCVVTAVLFGLAPAAQITRRAAASAMKRDHDGRQRQRSLRRVLLAAQVAMSLFLLAGATVLIRSLQNLVRTDTGYVKEQVLLVSIDPMQGRFDQMNSRQFFEALLPRVAGFPGVRSVSLARYIPLWNTFAVASMEVTVEGYQADQGDALPGAWPVRNVVSPGYFATMGVGFLHGRDFSPYDGPRSPKIAIVNEQFGRKYFGNKNPLGYHIGWNGKADTEIVGVVKDVKYEDVRKAAKPYWYIPYSQVEPSRWQMMTVHARIAGDAAPVVSALRNEIRTLDQTLPVFQATTVETEIDFHLSRERLITALGLFFAALAALLAGVGIFGLAAQTVTRRMKEIGIRMALGAQTAQVVGVVVNEVLVVVGVGIVFGTPLLFLWSGLLQTFVYGVAATDLANLGAAICMILIVGLVGAYAPARRAANVDPMNTLRHE